VAFNPARVATWLGTALLHAMILCIIAFAGFVGAPTALNGSEGGLVLDGVGVHAALVLTVSGKLALEISSWHSHTYIAYAISGTLWIVFLAVYAAVFSFTGITATADISGIAAQLFRRPAFWLMLPLISGAALLPDALAHTISRLVFPDVTSLVREWAAGHGRPLSLASLIAAAGGVAPIIGARHEMPADAAAITLTPTGASRASRGGGGAGGDGSKAGARAWGKEESGGAKGGASGHRRSSLVFASPLKTDATTLEGMSALTNAAGGAEASILRAGGMVIDSDAIGARVLAAAKAAEERAA
jgi:hypothetical protein